MVTVNITIMITNATNAVKNANVVRIKKSQWDALCGRREHCIGSSTIPAKARRPAAADGSASSGGVHSASSSPIGNSTRIGVSDPMIAGAGLGNEYPKLFTGRRISPLCMCANNIHFIDMPLGCTHTANIRAVAPQSEPNPSENIALQKVRKRYERDCQ